MAEQEIIKHMEAAITVSRDKTKKWQHRLKEVLLEVAIIVFAVSLSIWFHNWSESRKEHREAREFLSGLKEDLKADLNELINDRDSYYNRIQGANYFEKVGVGEPLNPDSLKALQWILFSTTQINPRISRFEALKGSGKLGIIENKSLLLHITDLYAKDFTLVIYRNETINSVRRSMIYPFVAEHLVLDARFNGTNWQQLLRTSQMRMLIAEGEAVQDNINAYTAAIDKCRLIIKEIDEELK